MPSLRDQGGALVLLFALVTTACAPQVAREKRLEKWTPARAQQAEHQLEGERSGDLVVLLAFSGGGTRAAAFAYGVLQELAATEVMTENGPKALHREIDVISSVSGGSFTSAYFGLRGDRIFDDFEERFLRKNIERSLIWQLLRPVNWWKLSAGSYGRSDLAAEYYAEHIFDHAKFEEMERPDAPVIVINATELGLGVRFTFFRHYFDLICADLDEYPVARAVAASSAVPGLLSPIVLESFAGSCGYETMPWLLEAAKERRHTVERANAESILELLDREERPWLHLVDGGITDNLGLRAFWTRVTLTGGLDKALPELARPGEHQVLLVLVNAITKPKPKWTSLSKGPSLGELIGSVSSIQLARYDLDTIELIQESMGRWAKEASGPDDTVTFDFVEVSFDGVEADEKREYLNEIGTNFGLKDEQVDALISAAREVLKSSPEFQRFLERNRQAHSKP